jgi:hypothetical protein
MVRPEEAGCHLREMHSARDQAMRSVEHVVDQCGCHVRDADRIDNLLRTQDTAVVSRWIARW